MNMRSAVEKPDVSKLPRRYREYVARLERRVADLEATNAAVPESRVAVVDYGRDVRTPLGDGAQVEFAVDPSLGARGRIRVRLNECYMGRPGGRTPSLHIMGDESLVVVPEVTNTIDIIFRR